MIAMCKNNVIKKLACLAFIGVAIGGLIIFFKKFEKDGDDLFEEGEDDFDSCPGCADTSRSYTTISGDAAAAQDEHPEKAAEEAVKEAVEKTEKEAENTSETI